MSSSFQGTIETSPSSPYFESSKERREDEVIPVIASDLASTQIAENDNDAISSNKGTDSTTTDAGDVFTSTSSRSPADHLHHLLPKVSIGNQDQESSPSSSADDLYEPTKNLRGNDGSSISIDNNKNFVDHDSAVVDKNVTKVKETKSRHNSSGPNIGKVHNELNTSQHFSERRTKYNDFDSKQGYVVESGEGKENLPSPLNYRTDYQCQNRRYRHRSDMKMKENKINQHIYDNNQEIVASSPRKASQQEWQHHFPAPARYEYGQIPPHNSYALPSNIDQSYSSGGDWYDKYYGCYSYEGYHQPYMYHHTSESTGNKGHYYPPPHHHAPHHSQSKAPHHNASSDTTHGFNEPVITTDVHPIRTTSSSKHRSDVQRHTNRHPGTNFTLVDHTYRDFSGVPPTEEDRERYNNKKKEYTRRLKNSYNSTNEDNNNVGSDTMKKKRGRGNRETRNGSKNRFIGFMGTNFPARLHDLLSHDEDISSIITWLPHGRSWIVLDKKEFLKKVAPSHFQISKFESFTRQVNGWGFKRITQGPDINSYYHELFLLGMPHLIQWMKRTTSSGPGRRKIRSDPREEPDFYAIGKMYPIPDYYGESNEISSSIHHSSPTVLGESQGHPPQLNSSDCREVLDILVNNDPSPPKKNKNQQKKHTSRRKRNDNPVMYCSKTTIPSPIQPKVKRYKNEEKEKITSLLATDTTSSSHHNESMLTNHIDNEEPLSGKDIEDVKTFWSDNHGFEASEQYFQYSPHKFSPRRTSQPYPHFDDTNNYPSKYNSHQQSDFRPSEGTIGDRENFRWDDAEFVRERDESNYHSMHRHTNHHYSEPYSNIPQDAPPETTAWALI